jgi:hypothetical protein
MLMLLVAGVTAVDAQQMRGAASGAEMFIIQYGDELNLTVDQKKELLLAALEQRSQMRETRNQRVQYRRGAAMNRSERAGQRAYRGERSERRAEIQRPATIYQDILTEQQMERLAEIRTERAENRKEVQLLRNRVAVENTGIEDAKQARTVELLNRRTELMAGMQQQRTVRQRGERDSEMRGVMQEIREVNEELKNLLSAAEYEKLQQTMAPAMQSRQRAAMMRRGR